MTLSNGDVERGARLCFLKYPVDKRGLTGNVTLEQRC